VRVADVSDGSEERLRHFLESVVAQANADHTPDDSDRDEDAEDEEDEGGDDDRDAASPDDEMSERFRSFSD
jgi:chromatin remodeling complex protein RSC6